ncbi:MAG TPA: dynamin family protein, partial [Ilumatobacteraceae bacterium]|nr:dynamin family protein [Ilumatobacteraceae bacterium]
MPETGSTEEFAVIEREQTSTASEATAPVAKTRKAPAAARPAVPGAEVTPSSEVEAPASGMTALVHSLSEFAAETGRPDLAQRLEDTHARLLDPDVRVIVVGEFKQGKSKLINALVNAPACPVDDDIATSVPTSVGYGEEPSAWIMTRNEDSSKPGTALERQQVPLEDLSDYVSERGNPGNERRIVSAEVLVPREILKGGLKLVDSPGVGGLDSSNALATLSALSSAHAVLLVSDASQEYTEP